MMQQQLIASSSHSLLNLDVAFQAATNSRSQGSVSSSGIASSYFSSSSRTAVATGPPPASFAPTLCVPYHQRVVKSHVTAPRPLYSETNLPSPCGDIVLRQNRSFETRQRRYQERQDQLVSPDLLIQETVNDIVAHIHEAPFLHFLYESSDQASKYHTTTARRQQLFFSNNISSEEKWKAVKESVDEASPYGVILVHRLDDQNIKCCCPSEMLPAGGDNDTSLWGLLVLGKSITRSACYILKTTTVSSPSGGKCTAFSLTKAKCFGPSWHDQMQRCWLL